MIYIANICNLEKNMFQNHMAFASKTQIMPYGDTELP